MWPNILDISNGCLLSLIASATAVCRRSWNLKGSPIEAFTAGSLIAEVKESIEYKITKIFLHPKVNGWTINYSGRDYAFRKTKKSFEEYENFYNSFEEYLDLSKQYRDEGLNPIKK